MMGVKQAIFSRINGRTAAGGRVYPAGRVPSDAALPYVVYQVVSRLHEQHQGAAAGLARARVQIDVWGSSYAEADSVAEQIRDVLDGYAGVEASTTIERAMLDDDNDTEQVPTSGDERSTAGVSSDYLVWHRESIPSLP